MRGWWIGGRAVRWPVWRPLASSGSTSEADAGAPGWRGSGASEFMFDDRRRGVAGVWIRVGCALAHAADG
jgi:hypothetical protein